MRVHSSHRTRRILAGLMCALVLLAVGADATVSSLAHATRPRLMALAPSGAPLVRFGAPASRARVRGIPLFPCQCGPFFGVAALSSDNVWMVGRTAGPLIEHWNGRHWRIVPGPTVGRDGGELLAIAAVSAHDIWAVGGYDASNCCRAGSGPLTEHWDGTRWRIVPSPNIPYSVEGDIAGITLSGVAVISTHDIWAVGTGIEHWDGHGWRIIANPVGAGGDFGPVSVAALSTRDVWAAGNRSDTQALMEHWDGRRWRIVPTPNTIP